MQIKDDGIGTFEYETDLERRSRDLNQDSYPNSGNHIAIFECELKQPPPMSLSDLTHHEYLMATRFNFAGWRLVDVDNFMGGNPPFTQQDIKDPWDRLPDFQNAELSKEGQMLMGNA